MKKAKDLLMRVNHVFLTPQNQKTLDRVALMVFVICSRAIYTLIAWMIGIMEATEYLFDI